MSSILFLFYFSAVEFSPGLPICVAEEETSGQIFRAADAGTPKSDGQSMGAEKHGWSVTWIYLGLPWLTTSTMM